MMIDGIIWRGKHAAQSVWPCAWVGAGAQISPEAEIGEPDLVSIGAGAAIDPFARIRGFVAAAGAMRLAPVRVGDGATMCVRSTGGAGATLAAGCCLGPCSSALELHAATPDQSHLAGAAFTTTPPPTLNRRKTQVGPFSRLSVNAHTMVWWSVGHHERGSHACMGYHPESN